MMSRFDSVNLRPGQRVRIRSFFATNVIGTIARIIVPAKGERCIEVEDLTSDGPNPFIGGRVWVGVRAVERV